jgi:hypothetical protein
MAQDQYCLAKEEKNQNSSRIKLFVILKICLPMVPLRKLDSTITNDGLRKHQGESKQGLSL